MKPKNQQASLEPIELPPTARPVVRNLSQIGDGAFLTECSGKMQEVVQAVHEYGGKGSVTIVLNIAKTGATMVAMTSEVKTKAPTKRKLPTLLFSSEQGTLTMHDPRQLELEIESVNPTDSVASD
jgi:hypothetical protein